MRPARTGLSIGVVLALVVAIWVATSAGGDQDPSATTAATTPTTSATVATTSTTTIATPPPTTATSLPTTTTTDPEARIEEVRTILEDLYFGWFDAIYRNDEEAVRQVVATSNNLDDFHQAVEKLDLPSQPKREQIRITDLDVLRDDDQCLVTYSRLDLTTWRGPDAVAVGVNVLLPVEGTFRLGTTWTKPGDLWESDCQIEPDL